MRYVIAAILFLVTYSASAGKGTLQHAPYETVGPMLGKISIEKKPNGTIEDMGRFCHGMGIQAVKGYVQAASPSDNINDRYYPEIATNWFKRATVRDYEEEIRYVQFTSKPLTCYYYQAGTSSGKAGQWNWRYPQ